MATVAVVVLVAMFGALFAAMAVAPVVMEEMRAASRPATDLHVVERHQPRIAPAPEPQAA